MVAIIIVLAGIILITLFFPLIALQFVFFAFSFEHLFRTPDGMFFVPIRYTQLITVALFVRYFGIRLLKFRIPKFGILFVLLMVYLGLNLFSLSYAVNLSNSFRQFAILLLAGITFVSINLWVTKEQQINKLIKIMYWGAIIHFIWSIFQLFVYIFWGREIGYYIQGMGAHLKVRTFGWMVEPNWLGVFIVVMFPWFIFALDYGKHINISKKAAWFGFMILSVTLLLNQSRGAWLSVSFQAVLWLLASKQRIRKYIQRFMLAIVPLLFVGMIVWVLLPIGIKHSFFDRFTDIMLVIEGVGGGAANQRLANFRELLYFTGQHPWIGNGVGAWPALIGSSKPNAIPTTTYLYVLAEVGIIGVTIFILILVIYVIRLYVASKRHNSPQRLYLESAYLSVIGILLVGWVVDIKTLFSYFPVFGLYFAMLRIFKQPNSTDVPTFDPSNQSSRLLATNTDH